MTLKDIIKNYLSKNQEYKRYFQQEQQARKVQATLDARAKNANERELERFIEEDRQKKIKIALEHYRKQRQREYWKPTQINKGWNSMKSKNNILKQKKIFMGNNMKADILKGNLNGRIK